MKAIANLVDDHDIIMDVVRSIRLAERSTSPIGADFARRVHHFMVHFADAMHHGKEERVLFAALENKELVPQDAKVMDALVKEHDYARGLVQRLGQALKEAGADDDAPMAQESPAADLISKLAALYEKHVELENGTFFPACAKYFSSQEEEAMMCAYQEVEREYVARMGWEAARKVSAGLK